MLAIAASLDLYLDRLTFINNTNTANEFSVCLDVAQNSASVMTIRDSVFRGNQAVSNTLARVTGARGVVMAGVTAVGNVATSTSAGLLFVPLTDMNSFLTVTNCTFELNKSLRSGVVLVSENTGNMAHTSSTLSITISNSQFQRNSAQYGGCSLTVSGFVVLSASSVMRNCTFLENECEEGGAAAYLNFISGVLIVEHCAFHGNIGKSGSAIYSTHKGSEDGLSYLKISQCVFANNSGQATVKTEGVETPLTLANDNLFAGNTGSSFYIVAGKLIDRRSRYIENTSNSGGVLTAIESALVDMEEVTCVSNSAVVKGGVFFVSIGSTAVCGLCMFAENRSKAIGGVVSIEQESQFKCFNCTFVKNRSEQKGSVAYAIFSSVILAYSTVEGNEAMDFGSIVLVESSAELDYTKMSHNRATSQSPGVILSMSNFTARNSAFASQSGSSGAFIFGSILTQIVVKDSVFRGGLAVSGGVLYLTTGCTFVAVRSRFEDCEASVDSSFAQLRSSTAHVRDVTITRLIAPLSSGAFYLIDAAVVIEGTSVRELQGSAVIAQSSDVVYRDSAFENSTAANGPSLNCIDCHSVTITNCLFSHNSAKQGGAVYDYTTGFLLGAPSAVIQHSTFSNNRAVNGGALYSNGVQLQLTRNAFTNNSAMGRNYADSGLLNQGIGGAAFVVCEFMIFCEFLIEGNTFQRNFADKRGGAVYWFDSFPRITANAMLGNSALYGADIASFPVQLARVDAAGNVAQYVNNASVPLAYSFQNVASGQQSQETIRLALIDHYTNIVTDDSSSTAQITSDLINTTVSGSMQAVAIAGIFTFSQLTFRGPPKSTQSITIATSGVDMYLKDYTQDPSDYIPSVSVSLSFRDCAMGESLQGIECYPCPEGTFSLDPAEPCNPCPSHVICYGNYTMAPVRGYWRPDPTLNLFFACPNSGACLGSPDSLPQVSLTGVCAEGYQSNLCSACVAGYSVQGRDTCEKCPSLTSNVILSSLIVTTSLCVGGVFILVAIRGASRPRSELAVHLKLFTNYLQMIVVATSLNLNWPDFVSTFLSGQDTAGSFAEQLFSFDCILQKFTSSSVYYAKLRSYAFLPAALQLFALLVWSFIMLCMKVERLGHKLVASLVMILFVLHPSLTKEMFSLFSCKELKPEEFWLAADLSLRCWSSEHIQNILTVSLPSILVWIFGLPATCLLILFRLRKRLAAPLTQLKFSFLYKGYGARWYFWEFVILYRKVALVSAAVFLSAVPRMVQALSVLAILLASLFLQVTTQPFITPTFNTLEQKLVLVSTITIYAGLFYQTDSIRKAHSALAAKAALFVAILLANCAFLGTWLRCVVPLLFDSLRKRFRVISEKYKDRRGSLKSARVGSSVDESAVSKSIQELPLSDISEVCATQSSPVSRCMTPVPLNTPCPMVVELSSAEEAEASCEDVSSA